MRMQLALRHSGGAQTSALGMGGGLRV
jgi:hypothetical protein